MDEKFLVGEDGVYRVLYDGETPVEMFRLSKSGEVSLPGTSFTEVEFKGMPVSKEEAERLVASMPS